MLSTNCDIIGLGQCGCNIGSIFEKYWNYNTLMINSSIEDLQSIKAKHKFQIKGSNGVAKDADLARKLLSQNNNYPNMLDSIKSQITHKISFVIFGAAGGTGNGISSIVIEVLLRMGKIVCPVVVIPNEKKESLLACKNAYNVLRELDKNKSISSTFIIDNKRNPNKFALNHAFAMTLNEYLTREHKSAHGNLDEHEMESLLSDNGFAILTKLSKAKSTMADIINSISDNIYADIEKDKILKRYGLSFAGTGDVNRDDLIQELGEPYDDLYGYGVNSTLLYVSGLSFPKSRLNAIKERYTNNMERLATIYEQQTSATLEEDEDTLEDIFSSSNTPSAPSIELDSLDILNKFL